MRDLLSILLLLTQFQPLVGVALCQGLAGGEASLIEDGCPMPEATPGEANRRVTDPLSGTTLTSATSLHDCMFAEACLNASPAVISAKLAFRSVPPPHDRSSRIVSALHGSDEFPPPIPPPNY